ncbi:MAG: ankyrin repeat domain-containing protein [Nitrosomonadales bacterium]|nr:ankyrin repeat domain-containing protein [Nitrosomonadales bacterium]
MKRSNLYQAGLIAAMLLAASDFVSADVGEKPSMQEVRKVFENGLNEAISQGRVKIGNITRVGERSKEEAPDKFYQLDAEIELVFLKNVTVCPAGKQTRLAISEAGSGRPSCAAKANRAGSRLTVIGAIDFEKTEKNWKAQKWAIKPMSWDDELLDGVMNGDANIVRAAILKGANVNAKNRYGVPALLSALIQKKPDEIIKMLVRNGADVNAKGDAGWTPLIWAIYNDNAEVVKALVSKGANVNAQDDNGKEALIYAMEKNNTVIIQKLLNNGADVNARNSNGVPALVWSAANGSADIVKMLLARGAIVNAKDNLGHTALDVALENGNAGIVQMLRDRGARAGVKSAGDQ